MSEYLTFKKRREHDLRVAYQRMIQEGVINMQLLSMTERADMVRRSPAPCLYIGVKHCVRIIRQYYKDGYDMKSNRENKKRLMYIISEFERLREKHAYATSTITNLAKVICTNPAPSFFCGRQKAMQALFYFWDCGDKDLDEIEKNIKRRSHYGKTGIWHKHADNGSSAQKKKK